MGLVVDFRLLNRVCVSVMVKMVLRGGIYLFLLVRVVVVKISVEYVKVFNLNMI